MVCEIGSQLNSANLIRFAGLSSMMSAFSPIVMMRRSSGKPSSSWSTLTYHSPNLTPSPTRVDIIRPGFLSCASWVNSGVDWLWTYSSRSSRA